MPYIGRAATNTGSVRYLDNIASGFDGSDTTFTAQVGGVNITPDQENVEVYLDGVFQHPGSGNAYTISGSTITFTEAPVANTVFTGYVVGAGAYLDDKAVSSAKLDDDAVTAAKLDDDGTGFQVGDLGVGGSLTSGDKLTVTGRARVSGGIIGDLTGDVTGNVTGNTSGTAATVTGAAQSAITSVGTLTSFRSTGIDDNADALAITIDSSERVGIGTASPARNLVISSSGQTDVSILAGTSASAQLQFGDSGDDNIGQIEYNNSDNDMAFYTNATEQMTIKSDGKVGIGDASPDHKLHIKFVADAAFAGDGDLDGESIMLLEGSNSDNEATMIRFKNHGSMNNYFGVHQVGASGPGDFVWTSYDGSSAYAETFRVKANGNIFAKKLNQTGTTSNRYPLYWVYSGSDGSIEPYTGSVRAMKKDIADMGSVDWIHSLTPRSFKFRDFEDVDGVRTYKDTTNDNPITEYGLIAEEVDEVEGSDYIVDKDSDGEIKGVLYHNLVPILLKALQEQNERIKTLENA